MKYLLDNKLAPLTFHWAFLEAPLEKVVASLKQWREGYGLRLVFTDLSGTLEQNLLKLTPITSPSNRELFLTTKSRWTAYFDNAKGGGDVFTPTSYLAKAFGFRGIAVSCTPNTLKGNYDKRRGVYGGVQMRVYVEMDIRYTNTLRSIAAVNDGAKWVFQAFGEIQPWEEVEAYKKRRVTDRLTPELLEQYCRHFGLDVFNPDFYGPEATLIVSDEPVVGIQTLKERQREIGFSK